MILRLAEGHLPANEPQDHPDDGDEEAEPNRSDDPLLAQLRGQNRLSSPYTTRHRSWKVLAALGQLASTCRRSGSLMSPCCSMSFATL
jgi:hypothetical protein